MSKLKYAKARRIARRIIAVREWVGFRYEQPVYGGFFDIQRMYPKRLWRDEFWRHEHLVMPVIRARLRWPEHWFVKGTMPYSFGLAREDQTLFDLEDDDV